jgi:hypothetical protein
MQQREANARRSLHESSLRHNIFGLHAMFGLNPFEAAVLLRSAT